MCGYCVQNWIGIQIIQQKLKIFNFCIGLFLIFIAANSYAQSGIQKGKVLHQGALVYKSADFGAEIIAELSKNNVYFISKKIVGAFYKIKVKDGFYGYIADTDVQPMSLGGEKQTSDQKDEKSDQENSKEKSQKESKNKNKKKNKESSKDQSEKENKNKSESSRKQKPFEFTKYRGFELAQIGFKEDTMSLDPKENILFYGFRMSGVDTLFEGGYLDSHILAHFGAPSYYEKGTGQSAEGFILLMDFKWQSLFPQGPNTLLFFGFGPMLRFSKFSVGLNNGSQKEAYDLIDLNVGASFNLGLAQRIGQVALRGEWQYYWEKTQYNGFALSVQLPF